MFTSIPHPTHVVSEVIRSKVLDNVMFLRCRQKYMFINYLIAHEFAQVSFLNIKENQHVLTAGYQYGQYFIDIYLGTKRSVVVFNFPNAYLAVR